MLRLARSISTRRGVLLFCLLLGWWAPAPAGAQAAFDKEESGAAGSRR